MFVSSRDVVLLTKAFIDKDTGIIVIIGINYELFKQNQLKYQKCLLTKIM